jgi:hypothetical protein
LRERALREGKATLRGQLMDGKNSKRSDQQHGVEDDFAFVLIPENTHLEFACGNNF